MVLACCADDVVALLNDRQSGVRPGDIAVLLDTNQRIGELRRELIQRGVRVALRVHCAPAARLPLVVLQFSCLPRSGGPLQKYICAHRLIPIPLETYP